MKSALYIKAAVVGVILNIVLALAASPFATKEEIMPPKGASSLNFKSQIMHMLVHHSQVPLTSSLIIVLIVSLSMILGYRFKIIQ